MTVQARLYQLALLLSQFPLALVPSKPSGKGGSTPLASGNSTVQRTDLKLCFFIYLLVGEQPNLEGISLVELILDTVSIGSLMQILRICR